MQGERFNQGGDVALFGGSEFSSRGAVFYRKPRSQGDFILPRGQHFKGGDAILWHRHTSQRLWNSWPGLRPYAGTFKWPSFARKLSTTDELDRISGVRRPGNSTPAPKLPVGAGGRQGGGHVPKDSNAAVVVHDRATGKALEGADRQTDRLSAHYSKICANKNTGILNSKQHVNCSFITAFSTVSVNSTTYG